MEDSKKYSKSEISLHSSKKDCWLVIHGKVYDVTKFLDDHPGGDDVLIHASASGDATQSFEDIGHSSIATTMMERFLVGVVEGYVAGEGAKKDREPGRAKVLQERPGPSSKLTDYLWPLVILALAFGAWFYSNYYSDEA
ncbi:Cytochrome b5 domain-containing protein [Dioscorea alata]|uniref:Cytochrome b5 domain-containing protein n=1 Tax=Dioscorea alata TaxID=55571 RepID=A0ACB7VB69_DIOAL|nr:Cytochrome b5 domain-containing protein [Dioscorea alata]